MNRMLLLIPVIALAGCSPSLPVHGQISDGSSFTGQLTGDKVAFTSTSGLSCSGTVSFDTQASGTGALTCSNGQSGAFTWTAKNVRDASGSGKIGAKTFTITSRDS
jgi:hypothetical protein